MGLRAAAVCGQRGPSGGAILSIIGTCALCEREKELRESHVLPAFLFRWLKKRSITGHIRKSDEIDLRVQDGTKKPWLCDECENAFGRNEKHFASKLFHPWSTGSHEIEYHEWLLRFCTSVSWRVLKHCKGLNPEQQYTAEEDAAAVHAEAVWRDFLLERRSSIGKFEQHLIPWDIVRSSTAPNLPVNFNRFITGAIEMDIVGSSKTMMTYAKLGRFMVFGMIRKGREPWEGTRVLSQHGHIRARKYVVPGTVGSFINQRAMHAHEALANMSPTQVAKVDAAVEQNIAGKATSDHVRAILADAALFGEDVVLRT